MRISAENREEISRLPLHDACFSGFEYRYDDRMVQMQCFQPHKSLRHRLVFEGVIGLDMQACAFWGEGNSILGLTLGTGGRIAAYRKSLEEQPVFQGERLEAGEYIEAEIEINSGDVLGVVCRSLDVQSAPYRLEELILPKGEKRRWAEYAALIAVHRDGELAPHLPRLLEWTQDMNWPGAQRIAARIARMPREIRRPALEEAWRRAQAAGDEDWAENLSWCFASDPQQNRGKQDE